MRILSRYLLWTAISLTAVAGAALYFRPDPLAGCRARPTPECLGDAALLTVDANLNSYRARETAINLASAGQFGRANNLLELRPQESVSDLQHLNQSLAIWRSLWLAREIGLTERSLTPIEKLRAAACGQSASRPHIIFSRSRIWGGTPMAAGALRDRAPSRQRSRARTGWRWSPSSPSA